MRKSPWEHLRDEEKNGHYAEFAAWQEWFDREMDKRDHYDFRECLDIHEQTSLFALFFDAVYQEVKS